MATQTLNIALETLQSHLSDALLLKLLLITGVLLASKFPSLLVVLIFGRYFYPT